MIYEIIGKVLFTVAIILVGLIGVVIGIFLLELFKELIMSWPQFIKSIIAFVVTIICLGGIGFLVYSAL